MSRSSQQKGKASGSSKEKTAGDMAREGISPERVALGPIVYPGIGGEDWKVSVFLNTSSHVQGERVRQLIPCLTHLPNWDAPSSMQDWERAIQLQPWGRSHFQSENTSKATKYIPNLCLCEGILEVHINVD